MDETARISGRLLSSRSSTSAADLSDEELISDFRTDSGRLSTDDLFRELVRRYYPRISIWCFRFTGDRNQIVDLTQEVFLKAYRYLDSYRGDSKFSTWLYAVTRNHCFNVTRRKASEPLDASELIPAQLQDYDATRAYTAIEQRESFRIAWKLASTALDPLETRVMTLHYFHEMPLSTITRMLALSNPSGAKAYIVNARRKLARAVRALPSAPGSRCA